MILRRYGRWYHSVRPNFNPAAMTEIGFQRDRAFSLFADDFADGYRAVTTDEVGAKADGDVQRHAERELLAKLERALDNRVAALEPGQVLVVLNQRDDWPRTRERREAVIVDGENRFHFHWWVDPPLRLAVYGARNRSMSGGAACQSASASASQLGSIATWRVAPASRFSFSAGS